ncbi:glycosyltransferase family 39 protein, partial [bacterium]|nr:glycosyltransferase family 39 protein [bacterium]
MSALPDSEFSAPRAHDFARLLPPAVAVGAVLLGSYWRLLNVETALLFGDEFHSLRDLAMGYRHVFTNFSSTGSGMALPIIQRILGDLWGLNHWTIRIPALLGGIATLASVYPIARRWTGESAAAVATLLVASCPLLIFYSHFGRSYTLVAWLCLLLLLLLQRIVDGERASLARCAGCALLTAVLPYVQPISLGFVLPVFGGAAIALWMEAPRRREAVAVVLALAAGGLACLLIHLPAWASLSQYLSFATTWDYFGDFGFWDVAALMAGSRWGAVVALALLLLALGAMLARYRLRRLPLVLGCLGPCLAVAVVRPFGDPYAFARYAIPSLPFACIAIGWLAAVAVRRAIAQSPAREIGALALGAVLAALLFASGPYGVRHTADGPHANTYITMF